MATGGNVMAARIDPSETYFVSAKTRTKTTSPRQCGVWIEREKYSKSGCDALAAFEAQPHGVDVAQNGAQRGECLSVLVRSGRKRDPADQKNGNNALTGIKYKRERTQFLRAGANDIGRSDVAAALGANVFLQKQADEEIAEGDGPDKVSNQANQKIRECGHRAYEFNSCAQPPIAILDVLSMAESSKLRGTGEGALIAAIRQQAATMRRSPELRLGIGDDCAVLRPAAGEEIVVTTDFTLEGVHFRREWHSPESVGHRCLARGLSDIAAMGARPVAAFLSMALPKELVKARRGKSWLDRFLDGLLALASQHKVPLAGGDTAQSQGPACFDIVLVGSVKRGRALLRSGANPGDAIYCTGSLGGAAAELLALENAPRRFLRLVKATDDHPHLFPQPRIAVAERIRSAANAAIDISDGLSTDLAHLCAESGLAAELDVAAVPVHKLAIDAERTGLTRSALELALHGGDDYELLFTARSGARVPQKIAGIPVHRIGRMVACRKGRPQMMLRDGNGRSSALEPRGWEHFR